MIVSMALIAPFVESTTHVMYKRSPLNTRGVHEIASFRHIHDELVKQFGNSKGVLPTGTPGLTRDKTGYMPSTIFTGARTYPQAIDEIVKVLNDNKGELRSGKDKTNFKEALAEIEISIDRRKEGNRLHGQDPTHQKVLDACENLANVLKEIIDPFSSIHSATHHVGTAHEHGGKSAGPEVKAENTGKLRMNEDLSSLSLRPAGFKRPAVKKA